MKIKMDIVKQTLLQKIEKLESDLEKSFVDLNTNGKGKSVEFISKNGCKCKFTLTGKFDDYFIKKSIDKGVEVQLLIDDLNQSVFYFDTFNHKPKFVSLFNQGMGKYIPIDTNIKLNVILNNVKSLYNLQIDSVEIIDFIETKLFDILFESFNEFVVFTNEYTEVKSEFENYDNLMFEKWKETVFQTGKIKIIPHYSYRVLYENETSTVPLGIKFIKDGKCFRVHTTKIINKHPKLLGLTDKIVSFQTIKKGKYKITFEEVYNNYGSRNQSINNVDYYFTERNLEDLLIQIWRHNEESIIHNNSIKVDLCESYKIIIGDNIIKSDLNIYYDLEPSSDDYFKLTNRESLYEERV